MLKSGTIHNSENLAPMETNKKKNRMKLVKRLRYSFKYRFISLAFVSVFAFLIIRIVTFDNSLVKLHIDFSVVNCRNCSSMNFTLANNVTGFPYPVVPNIVHLVHFGKPELSFVEVITIKSVQANHKPDKIYIHCDCHSIGGKYWNMVKDISNLQVKFFERPSHIFGRKFSSVQHAADVARIQVLMKYGGIYVDTDIYVVGSLDYYRKFEMSIGWPLNAYLGNQVIVAHKDARFLKLWLQSYKYYVPERRYFNAGELSTTHILEVMPNLVHREPRVFGVHDVTRMLYARRTGEWKTFKAIHLRIRHRKYLVSEENPVEEFDEENIQNYDRTFGDMCRMLIYGTSDLRSNLFNTYANSS